MMKWQNFAYKISVNKIFVYFLSVWASFQQSWILNKQSRIAINHDERMLKQKQT